MNPDFNYHGPVVVFDLDDTLVRERDFCRSGFRIIERYLRDRFGTSRFEGLTAEMTSLLEGHKPYVTALEKRLAPDLTGIRDAVLDLYGSEPRPGMRPIPGIENVLEKLAACGIVLAIITDGRTVTQQNKIKSAGLGRFFNPDLIFISEEQGHDKNSPHSFASIVRLYPEAKKFIYIGDNPAKDIRQPQLLGWETAILRPDPDAVHSFSKNESNFHTADYTDIEIHQIPDLLD